MHSSQCEQPLVRADVAGGLLAADVLLAGLQGEHPATCAATIDRLTRAAARQATHKSVTTSDDPEVRATVAHRVAKRLAFGHDDVGPAAAGTLEQPEAHRIDRHD